MRDVRQVLRKRTGRRGWVWTWPWAALATAFGLGMAPAGGVGDGLQGQEQPRLTTFGLSARFDHFAAVDPLASPRLHGGSGFSQNGFVVSLETDRTLHQLEAWYGSVPVTADDGFSYRGRFGSLRTERSSAALGDAAYRHLRRMGDSPWWLGFALSFQVNHIEYEFSAGSAEGFFYVAAFEVDGRRSVELGDGRRLLFDLRVPLLGWAARPRYSTVDEERLQENSDFLHRISTAKPVTPADFQAATARVQYEHPLGRRLGFRSAAQVGYSRHDGAADYRALRFGVEAGLTIGWGGGR